MITVRLSEDSGERVCFVLDRSDGASIPLTYRSATLRLAASGDAALVAALPLAMAAREPLTIEMPVTPLLWAAVPTIMDVHAVWWRSPDVVIPVEADVVDPESRGTRHGGVFSQDLASFHLALAPDPPDLLFAVDADLAPDVDLEPVGPSGVVPVVATNLAEIGAGYGLGWHERYRGAALASVAHVLTDLGRVDLPAPFSVHYLFPWGSHAVLDPLWSGNGLEVRHRHAETDWIDRLRLVAGDHAALEGVRACQREQGQEPCGTCRGCLYLAAGLRVVKGDGAAPADLDALATLDLRHYTALADTAVLLRHADRSTDADLVQALEAAVRRLDPGDVQWPDNWFAYLAELGSDHR